MPAHCQKIVPFPLADGSLSIAPKPSENPALVFRMAADLIEADAFHEHQAAFLALVLRGHHSFQVAALIDNARQLAMQCFVATEMSDV